jgi:hypothetical protein
MQDCDSHDGLGSKKHPCFSLCPNPPRRRRSRPSGQCQSSIALSSRRPRQGNPALARKARNPQQQRLTNHALSTHMPPRRLPHALVNSLHDMVQGFHCHVANRITKRLPALPNLSLLGRFSHRTWETAGGESPGHHARRGHPAQVQRFAPVPLRSPFAHRGLLPADLSALLTGLLS